MLTPQNRVGQTGSLPWLFRCGLPGRQGKLPVCPTLAPRFSLFQGVVPRHEGLSENRQNFSGSRVLSRILRNSDDKRLNHIYKRKMSLVVERIKTRGKAPLFVAGHTSDARVGGGLRILFPFFGDRLVRSVGEHGEYLVEMPHRLFVAAGAQG